MTEREEGRGEAEKEEEGGKSVAFGCHPPLRLRLSHLLFTGYTDTHQETHGGRTCIAPWVSFACPVKTNKHDKRGYTGVRFYAQDGNAGSDGQLRCDSVQVVTHEGEEAERRIHISK